jgi:hypothetical protein
MCWNTEEYTCTDLSYKCRQLRIIVWKGRLQAFEPTAVQFSAFCMLCSFEMVTLIMDPRCRSFRKSSYLYICTESKTEVSNPPCLKSCVRLDSWAESRLYWQALMVSCWIMECYLGTHLGDMFPYRIAIHNNHHVWLKNNKHWIHFLLI